MNIQRQVLANGAIVVVAANPTVDVVAGRLFAIGGRRCDGPWPGMGQLLAAGLTRGTVTANAREIADAVESLGAGLGTEADLDYFLLRFKCVGEDWPALLGLAADLLRRPTFPTGEVELERRLLLEALQQRPTRPLAAAWDALLPHCYGDHPYRHPELGTAQAIEGISGAQLRAHHRRWFQPDRLVIALAGRLTPEEGVARAAQSFGDWLGETALAIPTGPRQHTPVDLWIDCPHPQNLVLWAWPAPAIAHPDAVPFHLLSLVLGDGTTSRLFVELRENRGLAYDVAALFPWRAETSHLLAYVSTAAADTATASAILCHEVARLQEEPLTAAEWQTVQGKCLGHHALRCQTNGQWAQALGWREAMGLPPHWEAQFVEAVRAATPADLQRVAQTYLTQGSRAIAGRREDGPRL
ncbi:MAG: insulinase family protein [Oscillatoriales cyanobacterium SM2_1_8]|nr:insulinase family protein [Oscillatoriales cyanobacterium SM2_1_8]